MTARLDRFPLDAGSVAPWIERLLWVFMLSFAFDYRASEAREAGAGAGIDQLLFLSLSALSTGGILFLGWRYLLVRPGAWLIIGWSTFLAFMAANAALQNVPAARSLRIILPLVLCLAGIVNTHVAACTGLRPAKIIAPVLTAACVNVTWRIFHGFVFKDVTLETARVEVQSSANNWIAAWVGASLLLRRRFHSSLAIAATVLFIGIFVTITRSLLFPLTASAVAAGLCFFLGARWGLFRISDAFRKPGPIATLVVIAALGIGITTLAEPMLLERWTERLFHHAADRNTKHDISLLTRIAEADAIFEILQREPVRFLHGMGIGASFYWHPSYMPEILLVFPPNEGVGEELWFAGHSTWTYALFSGGIIALVAYLALLTGTMANALLSARANASAPGPDQWLAFLPFIAACCLLSETLTSNPFDERLASMIFGVMAGLPQAFIVRASWIHASTSTPTA
ncbi:MAG: hypothetical protein EAZ84_07570 [Verrucomicrobia bacterium]|nr:MAG: hypothetical protein EAZ84_07570 [Verrucomicrobiota bacterium]TAE88691.1 MAG: hypothetical protein EAZ82_03030 [Verrucomicrobiota bacterium]TAF26492.1 MAG: hypothetical protein EAZ71_04555 [Verrucomicrobiota bacterium]